MLVSGLILALYFWVFFAGVEQVSTSLLVSNTAAGVAGSTFLLAAISHLWAPAKHIGIYTFINFTILIGLIALLLVDTGYMNSPFIALWMIGAVFAPVFGWMGYTLFGLGFITYITHIVLADKFEISSILSLTLTTIAPLLFGGIIWHRSRNKSGKREDAYNELTDKLATVAGQSEIVIAAIADGVVSINNSGVIQLFNPAAQNMTGWTKNDAINLDYKSVLKLHTPQDQSPDPAHDPIYQALSTNRTVHSDTLRIETADSGKKFLASITASPVGSMGSGVIVVFRDITKEKAEEREQAEFISTASHEMRTPVASIEGFLGLALNPNTAQIDEKARTYITKAQESVQHLGRLFQDLLDVSKADDGRLTNDPVVIDVTEFIHDIVLGLLPRANEKGLRVNFKPRPDLYNEPGQEPDKTFTPIFFAEVDRDHLREVTSNLIENAIKYTLQGSVDIDIDGDDSHIHVSVTDSGIGIPKEDIPHLFQKFYRVDNSDTREIGGTGLGLYLSRRLAEAMGGKIWVESEYKKGSTFHLQLPRIDSVTAQQKIEQAQASSPTTGPVTVSPAPAQPRQATIDVSTPTPVQAPQIPPQSHPQPTAVAAPNPTAPAHPAPSQQPIPAPTIPKQQAPVSQPQTVNQTPRQNPVKPQQVHPNTPLSAIETNSGQYIRQAPNIAPPPRQQ